MYFAGTYCATAGLTNYTGLCDEGWYCTEKSEQARPTDSLQGGQCAPGFYCVEGSNVPQPCDAGKYCSKWGLGAPEENCSEGFYCSNSSRTPEPDGKDITGQFF